MKSTLECVKEFHEAFGQKDPSSPSIPLQGENRDFTEEDVIHNLKEIQLELSNVSKAAYETANISKSKCFMRIHLISEELSELTEAMTQKDLVACLDALTDLQYVLDGTYAALGFDEALKRAAFDEVHRSNMSKLGPDGKPILSEGGRVIKGPNYSPPDLKSLVYRVTGEIPS